jgi:hypothetical protein
MISKKRFKIVMDFLFINDKGYRELFLTKTLKNELKIIKSFLYELFKIALLNFVTLATPLISVLLLWESS